MMRTIETCAPAFCRLIGATLLLASTARAQPPSTAELLAPSQLSQVRSSPSGSRIAGLVDEHGQVQLLVLQWDGDHLRPLISTAGDISFYQYVRSYRWLGDRYLLLQIANRRTDWQSPVIADLSDGSWRPLQPSTQLLKYPWGDPDHALLQVSANQLCRNALLSFCLVSFNLDHWGGERISGNLELLPVEFLAISPGEIYASGRRILGRDALGPHEEYRLVTPRRWERVPDGTFARQRAAQRALQQPPASLMAVAARAGIDHPTFVRAAPDRRVVGITGPAPEPAFVALDPKLAGAQRWLAAHYPTARVTVSGVDSGLQHGQFTVWDADLPPTPLFLGKDGALAPYAPADPRLRGHQLGRTHLQAGSAAGEPVAVTLPPAGTALRGVVVTPVLAAAEERQDPLHRYRPDVQAFARQGIAVVQLLAPIPPRFTSNAEGARWRAGLNARLQQVVDDERQELSARRPVCLYGRGLAGTLVLAAGLSHVGCTVTVNAMLNAAQLSRVLLTPVSAFVGLVGPTDQMLDRDFPAAFGNTQGRLGSSLHWVESLPPQLMLAYTDAGDRYADTVRGYTAGDFAVGSQRFRAAARRAGKQVRFFAPDATLMTEQQREVRTLDAVTGYVRNLDAAALAATTREKPEPAPHD